MRWFWCTLQLTRSPCSNFVSPRLALTTRPPALRLQLADIRAAIPDKCWEKDVWRSAGHLALDVGIVVALAYGAYHLNSPFVWPLYWFAQGTMFWALFVVGHDW